MGSLLNEYKVDNKMKNKYLISCEDDYVVATSDGSKTLDATMLLWSKIIEMCKECMCKNILNISDTVSPITVTQAINHLKTFEHLNITNDYRIALVELNPVCTESSLLVESMLLTEGVNIRTFINADDAKRWLFFGRDI